MRLIRLAEAQPGERLAKDVATQDGRVLLFAGAGLTETYMLALAAHGIESVWVRSPEAADSDLEDEIRFIRTELTTHLRATLAEISLSVGEGPGLRLPVVPLPVVALRRTVDRVVTVVGTNPAALRTIKGLRAVDEYTMLHSVEVSILSAILGNALGFSRAALAILVLSALLHDVGKVAIPSTILNKPARLTREETEVMNRHTTLGWMVLRAQPELPEEVPLVALHHHERWGGGGYPLGLVGPQIHPYARICAVADVYDAMTADRVYRQGIRPAEAISIMAGPMRGAFEPQVLSTFLELFAPASIEPAAGLD